MTDEGLTEGLYFFEMTFVNGSDFANFALHRNISWIHEFVQSVGSHLSRFAATALDELDPEIVRTKARSVVKHIREHPFFELHSVALHRPLALISDFGWHGVPHSQCHGDMTLENMLFTEDGRIVYLDLLDGELESFWFDVAKLIYDLEYTWSLRKMFAQSPPTPEARLLRLLTSYAAEELRELVSERFPGVNEALRAMMCLQAARVLPYTQDKDTFAQLTEAMVKISNEVPT